VGSITGSPVDYGTGPKKLWNLLNRYYRTLIRKNWLEPPDNVVRLEGEVVSPISHQGPVRVVAD
jgi:hypothetical protein